MGIGREVAIDPERGLGGGGGRGCVRHQPSRDKKRFHYRQMVADLSGRLRLPRARLGGHQAPPDPRRPRRSEAQRSVAVLQDPDTQRGAVTWAAPIPATFSHPPLPRFAKFMAGAFSRLIPTSDPPFAKCGKTSCLPLSHTHAQPCLTGGTGALRKGVSGVSAFAHRQPQPLAFAQQLRMCCWVPVCQRPGQWCTDMMQEVGAEPCHRTTGPDLLCGS